MSFEFLSDIDILIKSEGLEKFELYTRGELNYATKDFTEPIEESDVKPDINYIQECLEAYSFDIIFNLEHETNILENVKELFNEYKDAYYNEFVKLIVDRISLVKEASNLSKNQMNELAYNLQQEFTNIHNLEEQFDFLNRSARMFYLICNHFNNYLNKATNIIYKYAPHLHDDENGIADKVHEILLNSKLSIVL